MYNVYFIVNLDSLIMQNSISCEVLDLIDDPRVKWSSFICAHRQQMAVVTMMAG